MTERNPLEADRGRGYGEELAPGTTRVVKAGEKLITIIRTNRPYVYDLCDAYNDAKRRGDVVWIVDATGTLRLVHDVDVARYHHQQAERRLEEERAEFKRRHAAPVKVEASDGN